MAQVVQTRFDHVPVPGQLGIHGHDEVAVVFLHQCRVAAKGAQAQRRLSEADHCLAFVGRCAGADLLLLFDQLRLELAQARVTGSGQIPQFDRCPLAGDHGIGPRAEQVEDTHVPQLGFAKAVGRHLSIGHVATVDQVLDVVEVDGLLITDRVAGGDAIRVDGGTHEIVRVRQLGQRADIPVGWRAGAGVFLASRIEDESQPELGFVEPQLQIQAVGDHEWQMQEQLPEVQAVGPFEVHLAGGGFFANRWFRQLLSTPGQQRFQGDIGLVDQFTGKQGVHADRVALVAGGTVAEFYGGGREVDVFGDAQQWIGAFVDFGGDRVDAAFGFPGEFYFGGLHCVTYTLPRAFFIYSCSMSYIEFFLVFDKCGAFQFWEQGRLVKRYINGEKTRAD